MIRNALGGLSVVLLVMGTTLSAHHSPILFDRTRQVALSGTVVEFVWVHPHASIQLDVSNPAGGVDRWAIEMDSPNHLVREGWKPTLLKTGDKVKAVVNPLRSGEHCGVFVSIKLADGRVLGSMSNGSLDANRVSNQ